MFFDRPIPPETISFDDGHRRLELRRTREAHAVEQVAAIHASLETLKSFLAWAHLPANNTAESQRGRLARTEILWDAGQDHGWHIFLEVEGTWRLVGAIGLHPGCAHSLGMEVGYWVSTEAAGQGICTLATQLVVLICTEVMGLHRIQVGCDSANLASRRVIEKVGFPFEGTLRNGTQPVPPEIQSSGWKGTGELRIYGLTDADVATLPWMATLRPHTTWTQP